jgi:hypothetical protein
LSLVTFTITYHHLSPPLAVTATYLHTGRDFLFGGAEPVCDNGEREGVEDPPHQAQQDGDGDEVRVPPKVEVEVEEDYLEHKK